MSDSETDGAAPADGEKGMSRGELFPIVNVDAIAPVQRFYEAVFSAELAYRFPADGDPVYITLRVGRSTLGVGLGSGPAMYGEIPLPAAGHAVELCVYVDDLDATLDAAPAAGGVVLVPARDTPWGERVGYVRDPQGTVLLIIQDS